MVLGAELADALGAVVDDALADALATVDEDAIALADALGAAADASAALDVLSLADGATVVDATSLVTGGTADSGGAVGAIAKIGMRRDAIRPPKMPPVNRNASRNTVNGETPRFTVPLGVECDARAEADGAGRLGPGIDGCGAGFSRR